MKANLILPKRYVFPNLQDKNGRLHTRLYFLAGPVRGVVDWQKDAMKILSNLDPGCYIVSPRRYEDVNHPMYEFALQDELTQYSLLRDKNNFCWPSKPLFPSQTVWERYYLEQASYYGSIIFWLPCEDKINPRNREKDGDYARETRGEIARWSIRSAFKLGIGNDYHRIVKMVVGAESDFDGLKQIKINLAHDHYMQDYPVYSSLQETLENAVILAKKKIVLHEDVYFDDENK